MKQLQHPQDGQCQACHFWGHRDRCHILSKGSGGPDDDWNILLMCRDCHQTQHQIGILTFLDKHAHLWTILEDRGFELWLVGDSRKLINKKKHELGSRRTI